MPRWTEDQSVQSFVTSMRRGVGAVVVKSASVPGAHDLLLYEVHQDLVDNGEGDLTSDRAAWSCVRGIGLDRKGQVPGWLQDFNKAIMGQCGRLDLPHYRRTFVGAAAARLAGGNDLLLSRAYYLDCPPYAQIHSVAEGKASYLTTGLEGDVSTDLRMAIGDIGRRPGDPAERDLVLAGRTQGGQVVYRVGWKYTVQSGPVLGWSTDRAVPNPFPSNGFGVAVVAHQGARHLVFVGLAPVAGSPGLGARFCIGYDLDTAGNASRWSEWVPIPGTLPASLTGLDIAVADLEQDDRPDLVLAYQGDFGLRYRVGFNLLDLAAEPLQAVPRPKIDAVATAIGRPPRRR